MTLDKNKLPLVTTKLKHKYSAKSQKRNTHTSRSWSGSYCWLLGFAEKLAAENKWCAFLCVHQKAVKIHLMPFSNHPTNQDSCPIALTSHIQQLVNQNTFNSDQGFLRICTFYFWYKILAWDRQWKNSNDGETHSLTRHHQPLCLLPAHLSSHWVIELWESLKIQFSIPPAKPQIRGYVRDTYTQAI